MFESPSPDPVPVDWCTGASDNTHKAHQRRVFACLCTANKSDQRGSDPDEKIKSL